MLRWTLRLVVGGMRADSRWLIPIALSVAFALAALVPVQALQEISASGLGQYGRRVLGADLQVDISETGAYERLGSLLPSISKQGAETSLIYETITTASGTKPEVPVRLMVIAEGAYPLFGGELWSHRPEQALAEGAALSINALRSLGVREGDEVSLLGRELAVTASFPENLLSMAVSTASGSIIVDAESIGLDLSEISQAARLVVAVKLPVDPARSSAIEQILADTFGTSSILSSQSLVPVVEVGLARLQQTFLWSALLIILICSFGLAFGVEDYMNSRADEIATLKIAGLSPLWVSLIIGLRLALVGLIGGVAAIGLGRAMSWVTLWAAGTKAADMSELVVLTRFPWEFPVVSLLLLLAFGGLPMIIRLAEKPHRVLWSKLRGSPLATRTGAGIGSLVATLVMAVPVMIVLARWYSGPGQVEMVGPAVVLGIAALVLGSVVVMVAVVVRIGAGLSVSLRWPFTYLRTGKGRLVASTTAVAVALTVGMGTALLERTIDWELQDAIRRQVPFSVAAGLPYGQLTSDDEQALADELENMASVDYFAFSDVGFAFVGTSEERLSSRAALVNAVRLEDAAKFGSTLNERDIALAAEEGLVAATIWEERFWPGVVAGRDVIVLAPALDRYSPAQADPFSAMIMGLDPPVGLRVGLNAPVTVPAGTLEAPAFLFLGVRADPAYSTAVIQTLDMSLPDGLDRAEWVLDCGPIEVLLRSAAEELSFIWWATAALALMVSIMTFVTTSSVSRVVRSFELALMRTIGVAGWRLSSGPYAEAIAQGLIAGVAAGVASGILIYRGLPLFFAVDLAASWVILAAGVVISVTASLVVCALSLRRDLSKSPLDVLRTE